MQYFSQFDTHDEIEYPVEMENKIDSFSYLLLGMGHMSQRRDSFGRTDGRTDRRTDRRMDGRTDGPGRTDGRTDGRFSATTTVAKSLVSSILD